MTNNNYAAPNTSGNIKGTLRKAKASAPENPLNFREPKSKT